MLARMQDVFRMIGRQIHISRIPWVPSLNAEERTKLTWAKAIGSYESVPEVYKEFFEAHLSKGQGFPYTVFIPSYEGMGHKKIETLVCAFDREIHVLERSGNTFVAQCYPIDEISYVEARTMLLDSHIKICGVTGPGVPTSCMVEFNSVTDYLFTPILKRIRLNAAHAKEETRSLETETFDDWASMNFKFMNYARNSLLAGEKVIHAILQPEIRVSRFTFLGKTYHRTISPTYVSILTDRELIMIQEEVLQGKEDKYGGIWKYIPLNKITALSLNAKDDNLLALSIQLRSSDCFEYLFQVSMKEEVDQLLGQFRKLKSG